ncbi:MAG: histidine--tRNA ligase [Rhizobacter sp.]|nr:histidine--tRNA ligase [Chlorobiales bacterium]
MKFQTVRGTKDILPAEIYKWQHIERTVRSVCERFGYTEIRTPVFEETALFARGIGETTDVVGKEMFSFNPSMEGDAMDSITLRPEMTASVMRAYLQHSLQTLAPLTKVYYFAEMFRKERPQAGRQRQFWQFGCECLGSTAAVSDAEVIAVMSLIYRELGITSATMKLNSLGNLETRKTYRVALQDYFRPHFEKLDAVSKERFDKNPLRILDSKNQSLAEIISDAPRLVDFLDDDSKKHFETLQSHLTNLGIAFELDFKLVRGLDYYSRTAFELVSTDLGAQDALGGGGRYDGLSTALGSESEVPAIGFASGVERLLMVMEKQNLFDHLKPQPPVLFIAALGEAAVKVAMTEAYKLRAKGVRCEMDLLGRSLKSQMREANRSGATYTVVLGDDELEKGIVQLRKMSDATQTQIALNEIIDKIQVGK